MSDQQLHYIAAKNLRNHLQAIVAMAKTGFRNPWGTVAAMSSNDPKRSIGGFWKNKACLEVEEMMKDPGLLAEAVRLAKEQKARPSDVGS